MIQKLDKRWFGEMFAIMCEAFPESEYRMKQEQYRLFELSQYEVFGVVEQGQLCAFLAAWDLGCVRFGEHLATLHTMRNHGLGAKLFRFYEQLSATPLVFEVELPETELAKRRIGFYERLGYHYYGDIPYFQGSFHAGQERLALRLMMNDAHVERIEMDRIIDLIYQNVYHQDRDF